jgi:hypothetical protein
LPTIVPDLARRSMTASGIKVLEFNPVNPLVARKDWELNQRDHRKLLIVDGRTAFLGGINISSVYSGGSSSGGMRARPAGSPAWRDTDLQLEGPVVAELQKLFLATWESQKGAPLAEKNYFPRLESAGREVVRAVGSSPEEPYSMSESSNNVFPWPVGPDTTIGPGPARSASSTSRRARSKPIVVSQRAGLGRSSVHGSTSDSHPASVNRVALRISGVVTSVASIAAIYPFLARQFAYRRLGQTTWSVAVRLGDGLESAASARDLPGSGDASSISPPRRLCRLTLLIVTLPDLYAHVDAADLAAVAERACARPLDHGRPLLPAQLRLRRPRESRVSRRG